MKIRLLLLIIGIFASNVYAKKVKVLATTTIIYDILQNIGGDKIESKCLMPIGGDPHIYEPIPGDAQKVAQSDIIIKNGLFLEGWLNKLIATEKNKIIIEATEGIEPIKSVNIHSSPDPHAWMSPVLGKKYAQNIAKVLIQNDTDNADFYNQNLEIYLKQLDGLDAYIKSKISQLADNERILITTHDAFRYYAKQYGLKVESVLGNTTDADVQIGDVKHLTEVITTNKVKAVFIESTINPKLLNQIAKDNNIVVGGSLYGDSMGQEGSGADTYIKMLQYDTDIIVGALKGETQKEMKTLSDLNVLIFAVLFLFVWAFAWVVFKIKGKNSIQVDWLNYKIEVKNISVSYEKKTVISNINFEIESGYIYGLLGPNGAGKSTLFKTILGLIKPDMGKVLINNQEIDLVRNKISYIPQKEEIDFSFPATVYDVVLTGRLVHKNQFQNYNKEDKRKALDAIQRLGLEDFINNQISDLSGGQQQRVFIARALCQEAELLFFDEPFVGVDIVTEEKIMSIIKALAKENKTIVMIHHDLSKVKDYFDRLIMVNKTLIAIGNTNDVFTNETIAKTYSGRLAILEETDRYVF